MLYLLPLVSISAQRGFQSFCTLVFLWKHFVLTQYMTKQHIELMVYIILGPFSHCIFFSRVVPLAFCECFCSFPELLCVFVETFCTYSIYDPMEFYVIHVYHPWPVQSLFIFSVLYCLPFMSFRGIYVYHPWPVQSL